MRIDWTTIDKVIEWVRSRIYELCLPTERTFILFKYTIDDPVRSFVPNLSRRNNQQIAVESENLEVEDDVQKDL